MRISFARQTVTVLRAERVTDRYGNETLDWSNPVTHDVERCRLQPMDGEETLSLDGNQVVSRWTLDAPRHADLDPLDRVSFRDVVYEIDGDVRSWDSPTGRLAHTKATLKRVEST